MTAVLTAYKNSHVLTFEGQSRPLGRTEPQSDKSVRGRIYCLSPRSRRRLVFVGNNAEGIKSQFCGTYHGIPSDGNQVKKNLNHFLTLLRKEFPGVRYLWVMEFQSRGSVHFHFYLSIPPSDRNRQILAGFWVRSTGQSSDSQAYRFHVHPNNFIAWDMKPGYLIKYASKLEQKEVPPGYENVGRFWGNSRGLVSPSYSVVLSPSSLRFLRSWLWSRIRSLGISVSRKKNIMKIRSFIYDLPLSVLNRILFFGGCEYIIFSNQENVRLLVKSLLVKSLFHKNLTLKRSFV